ncbi:MAG: hypothetical protein NTX25_13100, partial [Proteobacteria bacterium]|nr:hypothetical protein [Pseudomonadota bacterium]
MLYEKMKSQKSFLRFDKNPGLLFLILFLMISACGKGSVASLDAFLKINKNKLSNFIGVKSLNRNTDGSYVLYWDHPTNLSDISKISYKIYLSKWSTVPGGASSDSAVLTSEDEGTLVKTQAIQLDPSEAPVGKGVLLSSLAGVRSYKLDFPLKNDVIYAFQVIASLPDEASDSNQRVLVYEPSSNLLGFEGISGLSVSDEGFLQLTWKAPSFAGILPDQLKYSIYVSTTKQTADTVVSAGTVVGSLKTAGQGQVVDVAEALLPSAEQ